MIDQDLIAKNIIHSQLSFDHKTVIDAELSVVEDFFTTGALNKLYQYLLSAPSKPWQLETDENYKVMHVPRRKISWHAETIVEELHEVVGALTPTVELATDSSRQFHGIVIWEDSAGYAIPWHTDNPLLAATIQIYLEGPDTCPGTEFLLANGETHICGFQPNTGYFINQTQRRPMHRTVTSVPAMVTRHSLFAMWV